MRIDARRWIPGLLFVLVVAVRALMAQEEGTETPPPAAEPQEEPPQEASVARAPKLFVEFGFWYAQPVGTEYFVATEHDPGSPLNTRVWDVAHRGEWRPRYRFGYALDDNAGEFLGTYFSLDEQADLIRSTPGSFVYGETQVVPFFAGVFDDGRADAFEALTRTQIREWRLDFARSFLDRPRVRAKWLVGWREVNHLRQMEVNYFALSPPPDLFPPLLPPPSPGPRLDLLPAADEAVNASTYSGRGPEVGVEFLFPFGKGEKFAVEGGATFAALRGDLLQSYSSFTSFYGVYDEGDLIGILTAPYDAFLLDNPNNPSIRQTSVPIGIQVATAQLSGSVLDVHLGFRWKVWTDLEVVGGFRSSSYDKVGAFVTPAAPALSPNGIFNLEALNQKNLSVIYEGFYSGISYRY